MSPCLALGAASIPFAYVLRLAQGDVGDSGNDHRLTAPLGLSLRRSPKVRASLFDVTRVSVPGKHVGLPAEGFGTLDEPPDHQSWPTVQRWTRRRISRDDCCEASAWCMRFAVITDITSWAGWDLKVPYPMQYSSRKPGDSHGHIQHGNHVMPVRLSSLRGKRRRRYTHTVGLCTAHLVESPSPASKIYGFTIAGSTWPSLCRRSRC